MTAVAFDTLKFARALREKAKLSPEQAEGFADAIAEAIQSDLAAKGDIQNVRADIEAAKAATKAEIQTVKVDIEALKAATKADLREAELRLQAKIAEVRADLIKWVFGTVGFQTIIILGAVIAPARATGRVP